MEPFTKEFIDYLMHYCHDDTEEIIVHLRPNGVWRVEEIKKEPRAFHIRGDDGYNEHRPSLQ